MARYTKSQARTAVRIIDALFGYCPKEHVTLKDNRWLGQVTNGEDGVPSPRLPVCYGCMASVVIDGIIEEYGLVSVDDIDPKAVGE